VNIDQELLPSKMDGFFICKEEIYDIERLIANHGEILEVSRKAQARLRRLLTPTSKNDSTNHISSRINEKINRFVSVKMTNRIAKERLVIDVLYPGDEHKTQRNRIKKLLFYKDKRETFEADRKQAREYIDSLPHDQILCEAGVKFEEVFPDPLLEFEVECYENLFERASLESDLSSAIKRKTSIIAEGITDYIDRNKINEMTIGGINLQLMSTDTNPAHLVSVDQENGGIIHYYDGNLQSYYNQRLSNIDDDIFLLRCVVDHSYKHLSF